MAEHGYEAATLGQVVEEAGIPISSVYHYFGSKDGVLLAVMERGAQRHFASVPEATERTGAPQDYLETNLVPTYRALEESPAFLRLVVAMSVQPPAGAAQEAHAVVERLRGEALRRLRHLMAAAFDVDPRSAIAGRLARFTLAAVDGAFVALQGDPKVTIAGTLEHLPAALVAMRE